MAIPPLPVLPISSLLPNIVTALSTQHQLILEAPPGAGKTSLVPLALLQQDWLAGGKILMLEPRRMAARAAAQRMAALLGEPVGKTVGYRVKQDTCVSRETVIEVITGGILTRRLQQDPALEGVALVIFDEFHERHLDSDLGLALCLQGRDLFRDANNALRLIVMSATLNGNAVAELFTDAPIIRSEGRLFPVDIVYDKPQKLTESLVAPTGSCILNALEADAGNMLVFLPGQREIRQVMEWLEGRLPDNVQLAPLHGSLSLEDQHRAIAPPPTGPAHAPLRKVVLATDIAESSLTIEGVRIVIDAGRTREPAFDPATGMTRLATHRVSQASATQRCGRAGRIEPGRCYRLWSEQQQHQLQPFSTPEILQADLAPLALQLLNWGVDDPNELQWLDPPPPSAYQQGLALLESLGAIAGNDYGVRQLTDHGRQMNEFPAHPRIAHMLLSARSCDLLHPASELAAILSDPPQRCDTADISQLLTLVLEDRTSASQHHGDGITADIGRPLANPGRHWLQRTRKQAKQFAELITKVPGTPVPTAVMPDDALGFLLACAYPDRIAKRRSGRSSTYQLSNGRAATLDESDWLNNHEWLACAETTGFSGRSEDRIVLAAALNPELFSGPLQSLICHKNKFEWDKKADHFIAEQHTQVGALIVSTTKIDNPDAIARTSALLRYIRQQGLSVLPWNDSLRQWQARVMLLRSLHDDDDRGNGNNNDPNPWPDVSDAALLTHMDEWLAPTISQVKYLSELTRFDLRSALAVLLPWPLPEQLETLAPKEIKVPSGSMVAIDYLHTPPILAVKLQEMFGCETTPTIARGKMALMLHLLSPARRPLQITQDIQGFWQSSYKNAQKEMKGRYPKHPWPDDPLNAAPSKHTKARTQSG